MKHQWLQQQKNASRLIVFFNGWGFDASIVQHLFSQADTNILFIDDYRSLDYELPKLEDYQQCSLIAWSFGVAAYSAWQQGRNNVFDYRVAINGSMAPIDRKTGIPPIVMQKTIDTLSTKSFQVFAKKCFHQLDATEKECFSIDVEVRKEELIAIQKRQNANNAMQWDKVWISRNDAIFPLENLQRAWQAQKDRVELIDAPHAPFTIWQNWNDILV